MFVATPRLRNLWNQQSEYRANDWKLGDNAARRLFFARGRVIAPLLLAGAVTGRLLGNFRGTPSGFSDTLRVLGISFVLRLCVGGFRISHKGQSHSFRR
jgi:hypothetical protein